MSRPNNHGANMTLREVGEELGISGERVRKIEARALQKIWLMLWWNDIKYQDLAPGREPLMEQDPRI